MGSVGKSVVSFGDGKSSQSKSQELADVLQDVSSKSPLISKTVGGTTLIKVPNNQLEPISGNDLSHLRRYVVDTGWWSDGSKLIIKWDSKSRKFFDDSGSGWDVKQDNSTGNYIVSRGSRSGTVQKIRGT